MTFFRNAVFALALFFAPLSALAGGSAGQLTNINGVLSQSAGGASFYIGQLPIFSACLATIRNGTAGINGCRVLLLGDSTLYGRGATALSGSGPQLNEYDFVSLFLNQQGIPSNQNSFCGNGSIHPGTSTTVRGGGFDNRISAGSNWVSGAQATLGGDMIQGVTAASTAFVYQPVTSYNSAAAALYPAMVPNTFQVVYYNISTRGTITATATGGSTVTITGSGSGAMATATATASATSASNALTLNYTTAGSSGANFACVLAVNSAVPSVNLINAGEPGGFAQEWWGTTAVYGFNAIEAYLAPSLVIIKPGVNDAGVNSPAVFQAYVDRIIVQAQAQGSDVILEAPAPINSSTTLAADLAAFIPVEAQEAALHNIPFVDNFDAIGPYTNLSNFGENFDLIHPNSLGYAKLAVNLARVMAAQ